MNHLTHLDDGSRQQQPVPFDYSRFQIRRERVQQYQLAATMMLGRDGSIQIANGQGGTNTFLNCVLNLGENILVHAEIQTGFQLDFYMGEEIPAVSLVYENGIWFHIYIVQVLVSGEASYQATVQPNREANLQLQAFEVFGIAYKILLNHGVITNVASTEYEVTLESRQVRSMAMPSGLRTPFRIGDEVNLAILAPFRERVGQIYLTFVKHSDRPGTTPRTAFNFDPMYVWIRSSQQFWNHVGFKKLKRSFLRNENSVRETVLHYARDYEFKPLPSCPDLISDCLYRVWFELFHVAGRLSQLDSAGAVRSAQIAATNVVRDTIKQKLYDYGGLLGNCFKYKPKRSLSIPQAVV